MPEELKAKLDDGEDVLVVDIRHQVEFRERADDHPWCDPPMIEEREAPAGGPARPGHCPLLHLTQRGLQRMD
jgi:hypothetical protein